MPTTALTITDSPNRYAGNHKALTVAAADVANGNHIVVPTAGELLLIARNSGASTRTITIPSQPDAGTGRTADITAQNITAGQTLIFRLAETGWKDSNNQILVSANHAEVLFGVINLANEVLT